MNFQNIINKWNYDAELAEFLEKVYKELIVEFGNDFEFIIYEAFLNTEIILSPDNIYECLKTRGLLEEEDEHTVSHSDLKRASGVYHFSPDIVFNGNSYEIVGATRIVAVSAILSRGKLSSDNTNDSTYEEYIKTVLIHELGHMVKGYYQECTIEGNLLITKSGLQETIEELSYEDGKVKKKLISEKGIGIEEGLNSALEENIAKRIVNPSYKVSGYAVINAIANTLNEDLKLKSLILPAQMLKDKKGLIQAIDSRMKENTYFKIEEIMDRLYPLSLKMFSEMFEPEKMQKTSNDIRDIIINEYNPLIASLYEMKRG